MGTVVKLWHSGKARRSGEKQRKKLRSLSKEEFQSSRPLQVVSKPSSVKCNLTKCRAEAKVVAEPSATSVKTEEELPSVNELTVGALSEQV